MSAIYGTSAGDILNGTANNDYLYASLGNDELYGQSGSDTLEGHAGQDTLEGGDGDDLLKGGTGNDTVDGGLGDDTIFGGQRGSHTEIDLLSGGAGQDVFYLGSFHGNYYSQAGDSDYAVITDFELGQDRIVLDEGTYILDTPPSSLTSGGASGTLVAPGSVATAIYEGTELIGIIQGVDSADLDFSDSGYTTTLSFNGQPISQDIVVEAEDLTLSGYQVEDYGTDEQLIRLTAENPTGSATLNVDDYGLAGTYDVAIDYFDENDGEASVEVLINGSFDRGWFFNEATDNGYPGEDNRRTIVIPDLLLQAGDTIEIFGAADAGEWVRIDNLTFSPLEVENSIGSLTGGVLETGSIDADNTADTYSFELSHEGNLELELTGTDGSGNIDVKVYEDVNGNNYLDAEDLLIESSRGATANESIDLEGLEAGDYLIEVYRYSGEAEYELDLYVPSQYDFVYEYGNGDYYYGSGYTQSGEYDILAGNTWRHADQSVTNEAGEYGIYKITDAQPISSHFSFAGEVVVTNYYDAASDLLADSDTGNDNAHLHDPDYPFNNGGTDYNLGRGYSGLGSEAGFVHIDGHIMPASATTSGANVTPEGEYWFDNHYEVDLV